MWKWSIAHPRVGTAAQQLPLPKHKLKTTDSVDMLTSRFYMIYASTTVNH
jgi:hypothetical protein